MKSSQHAPLALSLMPAFFAAGCCATAPLMIIFGFSVAEVQLASYVWPLRLLALAVMAVSLLWYFWRQGLRTVNDFRDNKIEVFIIGIQTFVYSLLIYLFMVYIAVPFIWYDILEQVANCCTL